MPCKKSQHVLKGIRLSDKDEMPHKKSQHYQVPTNKGVCNLLDVLKDTRLLDDEEQLPRKKFWHALKDKRLLDEEEIPHKKSQYYQVPTNKGVYNLLDAPKDTWLSHEEEMPHKKSWHYKVPTNKSVYNLLDVLKDIRLSDEEEMPRKKHKKSWHHEFSDEVCMSVHEYYIL